jgi:hypothetical protein
MVEITRYQDFYFFLLVDGRIRIRANNDGPGWPKTYGFGFFNRDLQYFIIFLYQDRYLLLTEQIRTGTIV